MPVQGQPYYESNEQDFYMKQINCYHHNQTQKLIPLSTMTIKDKTLSLFAMQREKAGPEL